MFAEVLPGNTKKILAILGKSKVLQSAYLAGGTALALQLGHRISYDLDFFTKEEFDEKMLLPQIKKLPNFKLEKVAWRTIQGKVNDVRFALFYYDYPLLYPTKKFGEINLLDVRDIATMKIAAIASRGVKRDFIDLYFVCKEEVSLKEVIKDYNRKFQNLATTATHIFKSLVYFDDAEKEDMPHMLKNINWEEVKKFFKKEVSKLMNDFIK